MSKSLNGGGGNNVFESLKVETLTANEVVSADSELSLASIGNGTPGQILKANVSGPPTFQSASLTNTTNLDAGTANSVPYQSGPGVTAYAGAAAGVFTSNGASAPVFNNNPEVSTVTLNSSNVNSVLATDGSKGTVSIADGVAGLVLTSTGISSIPAFQALPVANVSTAAGVLGPTHGGTGDSTGVSNAQVFIAPTFGTGQATWRTMVTDDLPTIDVSTPSITGVLPIDNGGTGAATFGASEIVMGPVGGGTPTRRQLVAADISDVDAGSVSGVLGTTVGGTGQGAGVLKNTIFAGDVTTDAQQPSFRELQMDDLPMIDLGDDVNAVMGVTKIANGGTGASSFPQAAMLIGPSGGPGTPTLRALGSGDITAVSAGALQGVTAVANGGTGTNSVSQNLVFTGPASGTAPPSFRNLVTADVPVLDISTGSITGVTPLTKGGVGDSSLWATGKLLIGNSGGPASVRQLIANDIPGIDGSQIATGIISASRGGTGVGTSALPAKGVIFCGANPNDPSAALPSFKAITAEYLPVLDLNAAPAQVTNILQQPNGGTGVAIALANTVFAAPVDGGLMGVNGTPTFRTLYDADITSVDASKVNTGVLDIQRGGTGSNNVGQGLVFAGPAGAGGAPSFRALQASDLGGLTLPAFAYLPAMLAVDNFANGKLWQSSTFQIFRQNSGQVIGDKFTIKFQIAAGTYTLRMFGKRLSNSGIWRHNMDSDLGTTYNVDMYSAVTSVIDEDVGAFTLTGGEHYLEVECVGADPSGNYLGYFAGYSIQ